MSRHIDGRAIAKAIRAELKERIAGLGFTPGLAVVLVGDDPASHLYVGLKEKACAEAGIAFHRAQLPADASQADVERAVRAYNDRDDIDGILVQLPLPSHLDEDAVIASMDPAKDADGFHPATVAALLHGAPTVVPGLPASVMRLLDATGEPLDGTRALVIANSDVFYAPLAHLLRGAGVGPTFLRPDDAGLADAARDADIVIVAVGRPGFVTSEMLKPGAVVIDIGTNRTPGGTVGDCSGEVGETAAWCTPVPGGVGPMTVAMLLVNVVALAERRRAR